MRQKRFHIIVDVTDVETSLLTNKTAIKKFLESLPGAINMHVLKGPIIAEGIPENPGVSGVVIIDYSHISIHTFTDCQEALIDIFSCKPFKQEDAVKAVLDQFQVAPEKARVKEVYWG